MVRKKILEKKKLTDQARKEIPELFQKAQSAQTKRAKNLLIRSARRKAMKYKIKIHKNCQMLFCKHCYSFFDATNSRIRIKNKLLIQYCLSCKKFSKYSLLKKT